MAPRITITATTLRITGADTAACHGFNAIAATNQRPVAPWRCEILAPAAGWRGAPFSSGNGQSHNVAQSWDFGATHHSPARRSHALRGAAGKPGRWFRSTEGAVPRKALHCQHSR